MREVSESEYAAVPIRTGHPDNEVRLIDVLLRPEVMVFEPLWTVIPGNKAILPVLWSLFPNHPYLLDTDFEVSEHSGENRLRREADFRPLRQQYRSGQPVMIVLLDQTSGKFVDRKNIYQQLWARQTWRENIFRYVLLPLAVTMAAPACGAMTLW
ncbi:glutathionylspermidine synthase family protein [Escherichia coli]